MQYTIISKKSYTQLILEVAEYIAKGWKPQGGVSSINDFGIYYYIQAMIKE